MNRKSILAILLALVMALGLTGVSLAEGDVYDLSGTTVIVHTNDIHGRAVRDDATGALGYQTVSQLTKDLEKAGASVLLLDAGDAMQGMPVVNLSMGAEAINFMNAVGYDAMTLGNHEFDWGLDNLLQVMENAQFPVFAANIVNKISGELVFGDREVFELPNGQKIGVFGVDTPETLTKTHPDKVRDINFLMGEELYACAQEQVDALRAEGVDLVVCLGHLGVADESEPNRSTDVIANVEGIDLFIDGHSHTTFEKGEMHGDTLLVSTGSYLENIGIVIYDGENLTASLYTGSDPEVAATVNAVNAAVQEQLSEVFATTEVVLNGERAPGVRTEETNLGDFAADALLWSAKQAVGDDVVAAVTNGGGIRATIDAGDITMNDMKTVFPFGNEVSVLTVTGAELLEALEAATFSTPDAIGAFPQVAGIVFTIDTSVAYENGDLYPDSTYYAPANPGARVTIDTVGGEAFDPEALYVIATNDFTAAGGDTYYAFKYANETTGYQTGVALEEALVNYVAEVLGGVVGQDYAEPQGRITIK